MKNRISRALVLSMMVSFAVIGNQVIAKDYSANETLNKVKITEDSSIAKDVELTFTNKNSFEKNVTITNNGTINVGTAESGSAQITNNGSVLGGIINVVNKGNFANKSTGSVIVNEINLSTSSRLDNDGTISTGKIIIDETSRITSSNGTLIITGTGSRSDNEIKQASITISKGADFVNNGEKFNVLKEFNNDGELTGTGTISLGDKSTAVTARNTGILSQNKVTISNGNFDNSNTMTVTDELRIGNSGNAVLNNTKNVSAGKINISTTGKITGTGNLSIGNGSSNKGEITQGTITSSGKFTNEYLVTVDTLTAENIDNKGSDSLITVIKDAAIDTLTNNGALNVAGNLSSANKITNNHEITVGSLNANNIVNEKTFTVNKNAIVNTLTNNKTFNVTGVLSSNKITNKADITSGSLIAKEILNDKNFTVNENSTVDTLTNNGNFKTIGTLTSSNNITNKGEISVGSLIANNITNEETFTINNDAVVKTLTNNKIFNVNGSLVSDGDIINQGGGELSAGSLSAQNVLNDQKININGNTSITALTNNGSFNVGNADTKSMLSVAGDISGNNGELNLTNTVFNVGQLVQNQTINASNNSIINVNNAYNLVNDSLALNNSVMNINTLNLNPLTLNNFSMDNGTINISSIDVDLGNKTMGTISAQNYGDISGAVNIGDLNIQNYINVPKEKDIKVLFTDNANLAHTVNYTGRDFLLTPIHKYGIKYEDDGSAGNFIFTKGAGSSLSNAAAFNPAVLPSSVAAQAGSYAAITETFNYSFRHIDYTYMPYPSAVRKSMANKYAITEGQSTPYQLNATKSNGTWFQPYVSFENMHLSHGPRVNVTTYGSLVGGDSEYKELKNGWGTVTTAFVGYNGSNINYSHTDTYQNGGVLGATQTFYKNNFFTAITANAGASVGESNTMYGHENFTSLMAGIASKTGYNFEFNEGKFIIQPSWMMAYSFINTFDYTNAAGVRIDSDPLHSIQLHPNIKFIGNIKGWQPYANIGMVWNILNDTRVTANDMRLPEMSIKPYVEYGIGIQKCWKDRFSGFGQAMFRNGGRNGIAITLGFRMTLGKGHAENVQLKNKNKVVIKK